MSETNNGGRRRKTPNYTQGHKYEPTDADRAQVRGRAQIGTPHEDIAFMLDISVETLRRHYVDELRRGRVVAQDIVRQLALDQARGIRRWQDPVTRVETLEKVEPSVTMTIWLTKVWLGWKEHMVHEHEFDINIRNMGTEELERELATYLRSKGNGARPGAEAATEAGKPPGVLH